MNVIQTFLLNTFIARLNLFNLHFTLNFI